MQRIPKIIHYCWFGSDEYPELMQKCMRSWKEKMPDYKIKLWNANNFDVNICRYTQEAFQEKKYAFVSDYVRLYALYYEGGIYLDTDVEVLRALDDLLANEAFVGFENSHAMATWILGSEKGNPLFKEFLEYYENRAFILADGTYDLTPNPVPITKTCKSHGLCLNNKEQELACIKIYPSMYFAPYDRSRAKLNIAAATYCIHYHNASWHLEEMRKVMRRRQEIIRKYGRWIGYMYYGIMVLKMEGLEKCWKEFRVLLKI